MSPISPDGAYHTYRYLYLHMYLPVSVLIVFTRWRRVHPCSVLLVYLCCHNAIMILHLHRQTSPELELRYFQNKITVNKSYLYYYYHYHLTSCKSIYKLDTINLICILSDPPLRPIHRCDIYTALYCMLWVYCHYKY